MGYNIGIRRYITGGGFLIFLLLFSIVVRAQMESDTALKVIGKWKEYQKLVELDSTKKMIELKSIIHDIIYDLRYATTNNFMHREIYPSQTNYTFLREPAAKALEEVQTELSKHGLGLKIFDAYRPYAVTQKFWELVKDERYVANPAKGSGHNRGIAVDLTIISLKNGEELNMGTGFDNFTDSAHQDFMELPSDIMQNRELLRSTMVKHGFKILPTEWWHYYLNDGDRFEVLDLDFKKLKKGR
jgi:D-alanyl-D-alanine dipeptidase